METDEPIKTIFGTIDNRPQDGGKAAFPIICTTPDGQNIPYQAQQKDGVLTITVSQDNALLHSTTQGLEQLKSQGITEIRFVTAQTQSAFALADLLASGSGSVTLTHTGKQVTFTLEDKDISSILK